MEWQVSSFALLVCHSWSLRTMHTWVAGILTSVQAIVWLVLKRIFSFPSPLCETIRFCVCVNWVAQIWKIPTWVQASLHFWVVLDKISRDLFHNINDIACAESCLSCVQARLAACYESDGLPCTNDGSMCIGSYYQCRFFYMDFLFFSPTFPYLVLLIWVVVASMWLNTFWHS